MQLKDSTIIADLRLQVVKFEVVEFESGRMFTCSGDVILLLESVLKHLLLGVSECCPLTGLHLRRRGVLVYAHGCYLRKLRILQMSNYMMQL